MLNEPNPDDGLMCEVVSLNTCAKKVLPQSHFLFEIFLNYFFCWICLSQSRKYKYNRQALDYKAREMTQKYAVKVKTGDGSSTSLQFQERPNAGEVKVHTLFIQ